MTTTSDHGAMDAATRAELDALRRRAFSADADIDSDPVALARLVALEERLRRPTVGPVELDPSAPPPSSDVLRIADPPPAPRPHRQNRSGWHTALIAVTATAAFVLTAIAWTGSTPPSAEDDPALAAVAAEALAFTDDPQTTLLYTLRLDGAFGSDSDPDPPLPPLPINGPLWASALGEYYGYNLWIAGTVTTEPAPGANAEPAADELCIVLAGESTTHTRCVPRAGWEKGALLLFVGFSDLSADERPDEMRADQSVGLWWTDDDRIQVLLGRTG